MSIVDQDYQLDNEGVCKTCKVVSQGNDSVKCMICNKRFHAICNSMAADDKWATKTMVNAYNAPSTKRNFSFMCNHCLTSWEIDQADRNNFRIQKMEENMKYIMEELKVIKNQTSVANEIAPKVILNTQNKKEDSIWFDEVKLANVKAKPTESVLVIRKNEDSTLVKTNKEAIENIVVQGKIPVVKSYNSKEGNLVVLCDSSETRDSLKNQLQSSIENIEVRSPREKRPAISIVGLTRKYESEEIIDLLIKQNHFLGQFARNNDINDHIKIFNVKPLRGNQDIYQAFARVSKVIRQGLRTYKDKVIMGLSTCKIYDQYHVKRCNNCQGFGHFYKDCPSPNDHICAKCGENHSTKDCSTLNLKCTNCVKSGLSPAECEHRADDSNCPSISKQREKIKNNLNWS